jgi:flagellin
MTSINFNYSAAIALQNLNKTTEELDAVQNRINTGLKVSSPKDNGAIFNIAQKQRGDRQALEAVDRAIGRAVSVVDLAVNAGNTISDLLKDMKEYALSARDTQIDATARAAYNANFVALRNMISTTLTNASFDGSNLINTGAANLLVMANASGTQNITVQTRIMTLGGSIVTLTATASISTSSKAGTALTTIETSINNLNLAITNLGTDARRLNSHKAFMTKVRDELGNSIARMVDADLAEESAKLQGLQVRQQMGVQALAIANQAPQIMLALFR